MPRNTYLDQGTVKMLKDARFSAAAERDIWAMEAPSRLADFEREMNTSLFGAPEKTTWTPLPIVVSPEPRTSSEQRPSPIPGPDLSPESGTPIRSAGEMDADRPADPASAVVTTGGREAGAPLAPGASVGSATAVDGRTAPTRTPPPVGTGEIETYIRQSAARRGIDPDTAIRVALSEGGLDNPVRQSDVINPNTGQREESYGPFQLYLGGGLGNAALAAGIDPRNAAHWQRAVDFALDNAARGGWGAWHGAARVGIGDWDGIGRSASPNAGAATTAPAASPPPPAPAAPASQPAAGGSDLVTIQHIDDPSQTRRVPRDQVPSWMSATPSTGPMWRVVDDAPQARMSDLDAARAEAGGASGPMLLRGPLSAQPEGAGAEAFDPRAADEGAHEAIPPGQNETLNTSQNISQDDVEQDGRSLSQQRPSFVFEQGGPARADSQVVGPLPTVERTQQVAQDEPLTLDQSVPSPPGWSALVDAADNVVQWVQDRASEAVTAMRADPSASVAPPDVETPPPGSPYGPGQAESMTPPPENQMPPSSDPWAGAASAFGPGGLLEPAGGGPRIMERIQEIRAQATAELGRNPLDQRATNDPGWRARHPDEAQEIDDLQNQLGLIVAGQAGDTPRVQKPTRAIEQAIRSDYGPRHEQLSPGILPETRLGPATDEFYQGAREYGEVTRPLPGDENLSGPVSVPVDTSGRLNVTAGAVPSAGPGLGTRVAGEVGNVIVGGMTGAAGSVATGDTENLPRDVGLGVLGAVGLRHGGRALASRLGREAEGAAGALATLGNVPRQAAQQAASALQQFPQAQNWYQRAATRNARQIQQRGTAPVSPLRYVADLVSNIGYSAMLGPGTFSVNLFTGLGEPLWSMPKEFLRQGARAAQTRNLSAFREQGQMHAGAAYGLTQLGEAIVDVVKGQGRFASNPDFPLLSERTADPTAKLIAQATELPGRVWTGLPDAIFGTIALHSGQAREAAQIATDAGLKGQQWKATVDGLLTDARAVLKGQLPTSTDVQRVVDAGEKYAKRQSYRDELGKLGRAGQQVARLGNTPVLGVWASPFYTSIWNAGLRQAEKSPLGAVMNAQPSRFDKVYDTIVGSAVLYALGNYAKGGGVTGSGPADPKERELLQEKGWQRYSTLTTGPDGEQYYVPNRAYALFETPLNVAGEMHDYFAYQKPEMTGRQQLDEAARRLGEVIRQNPYALSGIVSILEVPQYGVASFVAEQATRTTPFASTARAIGTSVDPMERTTDRGKDVPLEDEIVQRWQQSVGARSGLPEAQDAFGQPKPNEQPGGWAFAPRIRKAKDAPVADIFREGKVMPGQAKAEIRVTESQIVPPVPLNPRERRLWDQKRGEVLLEAGQSIAADPAWKDAPADIKEKVLKRVMDMAAKAADGQVLETIGDEEITRRIDREIGKKAS